MTAGSTNGGSARRVMPQAESYLDWNATAPLRPEAAAAMSEALDRWGNPSSVHRRGRAARQIIERAREAVAALLGDPDPSGVVFVSGGTEANHLALLGAGRDRVLVSAVEHDSVRYAVSAAEIIPVGPDGIVSLDALDRLLAADLRPALVSVMYANNETGVIQPVADIAAIARRHGAFFHCDAVQAAGKLALDTRAIGADLVTLSAHKIGGPPGVGALVVTGGVDLAPLLRGGGQERRRRAGTENLPGIVGFAAAAAAAVSEIAVYDRVAALRDELEARIAAIAPEAVVLGAAAPRLPNTSAIATARRSPPRLRSSRSISTASWSAPAPLALRAKWGRATCWRRCASIPRSPPRRSGSASAGARTRPRSRISCGRGLAFTGAAAVAPNGRARHDVDCRRSAPAAVF